jgi:hypothetical protein
MACRASRRKPDVAPLRQFGSAAEFLLNLYRL